MKQLLLVIGAVSALAIKRATLSSQPCLSCFVLRNLWRREAWTNFSALWPHAG
jgi:hypothetical protein